MRLRIPTSTTESRSVVQKSILSTMLKLSRPCTVSDIRGDNPEMRLGTLHTTLNRMVRSGAIRTHTEDFKRFYKI